MTDHLYVAPTAGSLEVNGIVNVVLVNVPRPRTGASGVEYGVAFLTGDGSDVPTELIARTTKLYGVKFVNPEIVQLRVDVVHERSPATTDAV